MTDSEASRIISKILGSPMYKAAYEDELSEWYGKFVESRPEPRYMGEWITPAEDEPEPYWTYQFKNGSYIRSIRSRGPGYPAGERSIKDVRYGQFLINPAEPPELEAGDTAQLDSFLGSFTTR